MEQAIIELEEVCVVMYQTGDDNMRQRAEKVLIDLVHDQLVLEKCQLLLQRASSPYALLIAASTLTKKVSSQGPPLPVQQRLDIRNYVLNYLYTGAKSAPFVEEELMQLFARITKLSWFESSKDDWFFRDVISDISKFIQGGDSEKYITGVQLFKKLVADMNCSTNIKPLTRHRKIAASFRDATLFQIFQLACDLLTQALASSSQIQSNEKLIASVLELSTACLSFDFIGTSLDESGDDLSTVQIPTSWRQGFVNLSTSQLFFNLYSTLPPSLCSLVVSSLVQIVSIRRSLFNNAERAKFLDDVIKGIKGMLEHSQKLADETSFHEFCRMLARLKANYQLSELVKVSCYGECMQLIANFTVESLRHWHFSPNSIHYLLGLWQRLAASVPYVKAQEPHQLERYMPEVLKAYLESRMESVEISMRDRVENPLDDLSFVMQQLDQISTIARCEYNRSCQLLVQTYDDTAAKLEEMMLGGNSQQLVLQFGKLTWVVYLIGAVVGGRVSFAATDEHDAMDGELVIRVLQLMSVTDRRVANGDGVATIELALLFFFEQFRKIYIGEQVQKTSKVYKRLNDALNVADDSAMLNIFVNKIVTNLKYWSEHTEILSRTLHLLSDLSIGFSSVRKLVKLQTVQCLLENNPVSHFPFLNINTKGTDSRHRTIFFTAVGRLLMVDLGEDEERFKRFMAPVIATFASLKQMFANLSSNNSELAECAMATLIGLARDLRGLVYSFNSKQSYAMMFEIIYPNFTELLRRAIEIWYHEPAVTTPVIKIFTELVLNRGQRLQFDVSSPNGILLFKEASKVFCAFGARILEMGEPPKSQLYSHRLKGISLCFQLLKNSLCGGYVNFGVFRLYNDPCLEDALNVFVKLVTSVQSNYLLDYPKLSATYHSLIEVVTQDHMDFIAALPPAFTHHLLGTVTEGLTALDMSICTSCCTALDNVVTYLFRIVTSHQANGPSDQTSQLNEIGKQREQHFLHVMTERREILQTALSTVLQTVMFEDCRNQWSMSRPLLGLILINQDYLDDLEKRLCEANSERCALNREGLRECFVHLMHGVDRNLHTKTRDRFTQNMSVFRREVTELIKSDTSRNRPRAVVGLDLSVSSPTMMS